MLTVAVKVYNHFLSARRAWSGAYYRRFMHPYRTSALANVTAQSVRINRITWLSRRLLL